MKFKCTQCGLCCKHIGDTIRSGSPDPVIQHHIDEFPYDVGIDGRCEMLNDDNTCKVYNNRPGLCNVEKMYDENTLLPFKSKKQWYIFNNAYCNHLIQINKLDSKFLIGHILL